MNWFIRHIIFLTLLFPAGALYSQKPLESEKDLQKESERLFKEKKYGEALPMFSQLLSLYPDNVNYDFKFAVSMLYSDPDPAKAVPYLEYASSKPDCDKEIFFHLGKGYQLNYRFKDAMNAYNKFKSIASKKSADELHVDEEIEQCRNGIFYLRNIPDLTVLRKTEIREDAFFKSYDMSLFPGKLLVKPDDFKTETDKKLNESSTIYLPPDAEKVFFSSYGTSGQNGKDIYMVRKIGEGKWSPPENAGNTINTREDEDFPFLHPDGRTLYFCSKGHRTMGGYDIYKSEFDENTGQWSEPVNMGFPVNSPFDDILFLTTTDNNYSCFASRRNASAGNFNVFKIKVNEQLLAGVQATSSDIQAVSETAETPAASTDVVKQKASLDVNATEESAAITTEEKSEEEITATAPAPSDAVRKEEEIKRLSPVEVIDRAYDNAKTIEAKSRQMAEESRLIADVANKQREIAAVKSQEAAAARIEATAQLDEQQKAAELEKAKQLQEEADRTVQDATFLTELSDTLYRQSEREKQKAVQAKEDAKKIESMIQAGDITHHANMALVEQEKVIAINPTGQEEPATATEVILKKSEEDARKAQTDAESAYESSQYYKSEAVDVDKQIRGINDELAQSSDKEIRQELENQITGLKAEKQKLLEKSEEAAQSAQQLDTEAKQKQQQSQMLAAAYEHVKEELPPPQPAGTVTASAAVKKTNGGEPAIKKEEPGQPVNEQPVKKSATGQNVIPETNEPQPPSGVAAVANEKPEPSGESTPPFAGETSKTTYEAASVNEPVPSGESAKEQPSEENIPYEMEISEATMKENEAKSYSESAASASDETERKKYETLAKESQKEADVHYENARQIKESQSIAKAGKKETEKPPTAGTPVSETAIRPVAETAAGQSGNETAIPPPPPTSNFQEKYEYKSTGSQLTAEKAARYEEDANTTRSEADRITEKANASTSSSEKKSLTKKAVELQKAADEKSIKSEMEFAKANTIEFTGNESELLNKRNSVPNDVNDTIYARALNMESESRYDFNEAQNMRKNALKIKDPTEKKTALIQAHAIEQQALNKQQMASYLYTRASSPLPETTTAMAPPVKTVQKKAVQPEANRTGETETLPEEPGNESAVTQPETSVSTTEPPPELPPEPSAVSEPAITPEENPSMNAPPVSEKPYGTETNETFQPEPSVASEPSGITPEITPPPAETSVAGNEFSVGPGTTGANQFPSFPDNTVIPPAITELTSDVFVTDNTPAYSSSNPIPVNPPMPDGVVFKVQVGAFRNPIPQDLFGGIRPIMGETTDKGFKRYTAGMFRAMPSADDAKNTLRNLGYHDAFIVAFYNGERIAIKEAKDILAGKPAPDLTARASRENTPEAIAERSAALASSTDMNGVKGLVYTVQVGAFSKPVNLKKKYNLSDLYVDHGGPLYRYNAGIFYDKEPALRERINIIRMGIKDAFVTAYNNGVRISMEEADRLSNKPVEEPLPGDNVTPEALEERLAPVIENTPEEAIDETPVEVPGGAIENTAKKQNIVYRVLLGIFKKDEEIPLRVADGIVSVSKTEKVETRNHGDNGKAFYAGKFIDFESADKVKKIAQGRGVPNAKVVAFSGGREIPLEEAKKQTAAAGGGNETFGENPVETPVEQPVESPETAPVESPEIPAENIREQNYQNAIREADAAFAAGDFDKAGKFYQEAANVKPDDGYARDRAAETVQRITENTANAEREAKFNEAISAAEEAFSKKWYEDAKSYYEEALRWKPDEKKLEEKIAEMDRLITERLAEANRIIQEVQNGYSAAEALQNEAFEMMRVARDTLAGFDYEGTVPSKDNTISRGNELVQQAVSKYESVNEKINQAKNLHDAAESQLLGLGFKQEAVGNYLATIVPVSLKGGLVDGISSDEQNALIDKLTELYDMADFLQIAIGKKLHRIWDTLHVIEEPDDALREMLDEAVSSMSQPVFAFRKADDKLYGAKIRLTLSGMPLSEINKILYPFKQYNEGLYPRISKEEIDNSLAAVRQKYEIHLKNKNASEQQYAQSKNLLQQAQATEFPVEKERMMNESKQAEEEGRKFKVQAAMDYMKTRNKYELVRYLFLIGGLNEEEADFQRLEYIIQ